MDRELLIETIRAYASWFQENGATGVFMFGSRANGTGQPTSDLDLFIDYDAAIRVPNLFRLMQIEDEMSRRFGIPVTITTRNALHPLMKKQIQQQAIRIF